MVRKKRKKFGFKGIVIVFIVSIFSISTGYSLLSQKLSLSGKSNITYGTSDNEFRSENLLFNYTSKPWYSNNEYFYQLDMTLKNIGNKSINSWKIIIELPNDTTIVGGWDCNYQLSGNKLTLTNMGYNVNLSVDQSLTLGLQFSTSTEDFVIKKVILNGTVSDDSGGGSGGSTGGNTDDPDIDAKNIIVTSNVGNGWASGNLYYKQYEFNIKNESDANISSWSFKVKVPEGTVVSNSWNGNYILAENVITMSNAAYNGTVSINNSTSIGIIFATPDSNYKPEIYDIKVTN